MVLLPYCHKTLEKAYKHAKHCFPDSDPSSWDLYARRVLKDELKQGFQSLELKLNTVPCSRGDFAFTTLTFGTWDIMMDDLDRDIMRMIGETILKTRMKGHGGKQVVFPKLVFLYDENKINEDEDHKGLFEFAVKCSSKCMYPDFLSLTGNPEVNKVAQEYIKYGTVVSPMGA